MDRDEIIRKIKSLGWPADSYVVYGSGPLTAAGLRNCRDVDFLVSPQLFERLKAEGWKELAKSPNDKPLVKDVFEACPNWNFSDYKPTLQQLLATATVVDGIPFASLEEVRKWKATGKRPKDIADIKLIDEYLTKH